jgi:hypothetical protein
MKKAEFLSLVQKELDTIKAKATKEEIGRLNLNTFNHTHTENCIYGQMTGNCDSVRANELGPKIYRDPPSRRYSPFSYQSFKNGIFITALEKYLYMVHEPKHKEIIQYLKGDLNTIKL